jgi:hypothetical protein
MSERTITKGLIVAAKKLRELPVPPAATTDPNAFEMARIWAAHNKQHVILNINANHDPAAWGLLLVDLARHIANIYHQEQGHSVEKVLARIREGLEAEWDQPTTDIDTEQLDDPKSLPPSGSTTLH